MPPRCCESFSYVGWWLKRYFLALTLIVYPVFDGSEYKATFGYNLAQSILNDRIMLEVNYV